MQFIPETCPCSSEKSFKECCEPYLSNTESPATAEILMRSRYTAYVLHNTDYLLSTWHPSTRPESLDFQAELKWLGLKIVSSHAGQENDTTGTVEFIARNKLAGRAFRLHENSHFIRENGRWYYLDGDLKEK